MSSVASARMAGYAHNVKTPALQRCARLLMAGITLYCLPACFDSDDGRRALVELRCDDGCEARWAGTDLWSPVHPAAELLELTEVDPGELWGCAPDPDVDFCVEVDSTGHVGCYRAEGAWAVAVAPGCAVPGSWLLVGVGMSAMAL